MPVTSTRVAPSTAGRKRSAAQMGLPSKFNPTNRIAVRIVSAGSGRLVAISPDEVSQRQLGGDEDHAHEDESHGELVVERGGGSGGSVGEPPGFRNEEISAGQGN